MLNETQEKWSKIISEEMNITSQYKLGWMSEYAQIHEIKEAQQTTGRLDGGIYATPLNTLGMGNPMAPQGVGFSQGSGIGNTGADFHNPLYKVGSGDLPMSTLTMSLEIAAMTIGLELVPVIPSPGPWTWLSYMDFPYAGGKLGKVNETALDGVGDNDENKPIYIQIPYEFVYATNKSKADWTQGDTITFAAYDKSGETETALNKTFVGEFIMFSRINNAVIVKVKSATKTVDGNTVNCSIAEVFEKFVKASATAAAGAILGTQTVQAVRADLVSGASNYVHGFANFTGKSTAPMTRAENETGVGNEIGARMFNKMVQMGSYEVTGKVTRQQLQDMPLYGIDVIGKVLEFMQNQISQEINTEILDRVFRLGTTNALNQFKYQGVNLNLYIGGAGSVKSLPLNQFDCQKKYVGINNETVANWGNVSVKNAIQNTAAENITTHQRRIMSRILASANLIAQVSRRGRGQWVVTNAAVVTAMQDAANYTIAAMQNDLSQDGSKSLYFAGSVAGLNVYCDPYMTWDDTRVCVGRKSNGNDPGVIFMPYILADTVQITAEGTMAPKLLCNSRFAIVDAGFYPEQSYYTFMVQADGGLII